MLTTSHASPHTSLFLCNSLPTTLPVYTYVGRTSLLIRAEKQESTYESPCAPSHVMLDPVTALSIAGNLVQFSDFSVKPVSKGEENVLNYRWSSL